MEGIVKTPFKLTNEEILFSAAATLCLMQLIKTGTPVDLVEEMCFPSQYGFTASAALEPCGPRFVRITDIKGGKIDWQSVPFCICPDYDTYKLAANDILIARAGSIGKSFIVKDVPELSVFASYMIRLRTKEEIIPQYLYWCFQSQQFWQQIMAAHRGSAMKNINSKMLADLKFPNPPRQIQEAIVLFLEGFKEKIRGVRRDLPELQQPLTEVKAIVARIEELAAKAEEARGLRKKTVEEVEILTGATITTLLRTLVNAEQSTIDNIAEVRGGIQKGPHRIAGSNPVRYLTVAHVHRNKISLSDPRYFEVSSEELVRWLLEPGDVLIIEGNGSADQVGRTALFRGEIDRCVHQNHVIRIRPDKRQIDPEFLNLFFNSPVGQDEVQSRSRTTSGLRNLSVGRIKQISVPIPPLPEQRRIVAYLDDLQARVDAVKRLQAETQAELDALLPSILDRAFRGELV